MTQPMPSTTGLPPTENGYPRFSDMEMDRRRRSLEAQMLERHVGHLVVYGGSRGSTEIPWLTGWHVTREAIAILTPGQPIHLLVQFYNHVPNARDLARKVVVTWGGPNSFESVASRLASLGARSSRVGWIGPLPHRAFRQLMPHAKELIDLSDIYPRLRMMKSDEEIVWMRVGAQLTDRSLQSLVAHARPGATEAELADAVERAYVASGGTNHIHFFAVSSMDKPGRCVPAQWPSSRPVSIGDAIVTELSTSYWGYAGQVLRTIAVRSKPTGLYRDLHDVAEAIFDAVVGRVRAGVHVRDLVAAAELITESGYTIYDDLVHGSGGGYLPPVLRTHESQNEPIPDITLKAGMTIVVQPNVVTFDEGAGVQTGELLLVTEEGAERFHAAPKGLLLS